MEMVNGKKNELNDQIIVVRWRKREEPANTGTFFIVDWQENPLITPEECRWVIDFLLVPV
ncbi:MAG: hypothetical protein ACFFD4_19765 [Candidatus Odinarchaeota archaeon]